MLDGSGGDRAAEHAAWSYPSPPPHRLPLRGYVAFEWSKMDAWFEEDDEVYVHARDPYKRVDVLHSSRHVRVVVAGALVAETRRPSLVFETGLPTRYYVPKADVRMDLLVPTETETRCPYKGVATYYSVRVGMAVVPDVAWYYRHPIPECSKIENLVCFYNERVDALYVDGELQPRPQTRWSASEALGEVGLRLADGGRHRVGDVVDLRFRDHQGWGQRDGIADGADDQAVIEAVATHGGAATAVGEQGSSFPVGDDLDSRQEAEPLRAA